MKILLTLASVAVLVGTAAPAHADGNDDIFLATLSAAGITFPDAHNAVAAGRWVCFAVHGGTAMADVVKKVQVENPGLQQASSPAPKDNRNRRQEPLSGSLVPYT